MLITKVKYIHQIINAWSSQHDLRNTAAGDEKSTQNSQERIAETRNGDLFQEPRRMSLPRFEPYVRFIGIAEYPPIKHYVRRKNNNIFRKTPNKI